MNLQLRKTKLRRLLLARVALPLVLCFMAFIAQAHTIELRAKINNDGSATFYARTYHNMSGGTSGGFIIDGVMHPFQGTFRATELPDGTELISACSYNFSGNDYFQYVTIPNFDICVAHTFSCTSNAPEAPYCNLTNTLKLGAPQITVQPAFANGVACLGSTGVVHVAVSGDMPTFQWQINTGSGFVDVADDAVYSGATTSTLTIGLVTPAMASDVFRCVISAMDKCGTTTSLTSNDVALAPGQPATVTTDPADANICAGGNASFSVEGTGSSLTYTWQQSTDSGATFNDMDAQGPMLTINGMAYSANGYQYRAIINGSCAADTSKAATLNVFEKAIITAQPANKATCEGMAVTFDAGVKGLGLSYQWEVSTDGGTSFSKVNGATNATLQLNKALTIMNGYEYRLIVKSECGPDVTTDAAMLTVNSYPAITSNPASVTVCNGSMAAFSVATSGSNLSYQWQKSTDNGATWQTIADATANTYQVATTAADSSGTMYHVVVSSACTDPMTSANAMLSIVKATPAFTVEKNCTNVPVHFVNQTKEEGAGAVKYTWNYGDGSSSTLANSSHTYTAAGSYTVQLIATLAACPFASDTTEKTIVVENAVAGTRLPTVDAVANRNIQLQPRNFAADYRWYSADGAVNSTTKTPDVTLQKEEKVMVDMTFASGCVTTDTLLVRLFKSDAVFIPSAFTPDGDGHNDYLKVIMVQARQLKSFRVYNRWGNLVFQTNDPTQGWDGKWKGEKQQGETYLWYCEAIAQDGSLIKKSGNVTLIR